jgi:tripartite-type tricarboxylate transporter receptor subunit TctC
MLRRRQLPLIAAGLLAAPSVVRAQSGAWPSRAQVRIVLPFPPGGFSDSVSRTMLPGISAAIGQTAVIDNRPGAGGTVGIDHAAKSPPDGYTLCISHVSPHGTAPGVYPNLPYDPVTDFTHLVMICETPTVLMVRRDSPLNSFQKYLEAARGPGLRWGTSGVGSIGHLQGEVFLRAAKA